MSSSEENENIPSNFDDKTNTVGRDDNREREQGQSSWSAPNTSTLIQVEEKMRRKLQFFFMNPIEKWRAKRKFPYKFVVQVIKIVLVTLQLCLFAHNRYNHVNYTWDNRISFSHLFLLGWDSTREINAYPPGAGPLAVYKVDEFYNALDYAYTGYSNLSNAIGPYSYNNEDNNKTDPIFCTYYYKKGIIHGFNESYEFNSEIVYSCVNFTNGENQLFKSKEFIKNVGIEVNFAALVRAELLFSLKTINFRAAGPITPPDCYRFDIKIIFDNEDHDGQMSLILDAEPFKLACKGDKAYVTNNQIDQILRSVLNILVIFICSISLILCSRAIYRAQLLKELTVHFFHRAYNKELSLDGRLEFLNIWYIMIIINDFLIIMGSAIKEQIERNQFTNDQWNVCSMFLGIGNLLVWFGVLRYLGFFKTYNVVILTLKKAAPKIFRFSCCALLLYAGFMFCGWLVLGPYHMKFRSLATTSECLFSLINGDDMFATFSIMSRKSPMLWWFSRVYLYSFISLYIYVVLSLFISVIMDAYDTIKQYYKEGFPKNDLQQFVGEISIEEVSSGLYRTQSSSSLNEVMNSLFCCNFYRRAYSKIGGGNSSVNLL
uniref:Transient receptor potential cation channel, mucolipin n=1 Tax=Heliconius melpomene TaxID=34740 RepID=A0A517BDY7_HELME|nr:Transient receptor potential cation channel, mucolipin [Heliconius melpomene]